MILRFNSIIKSFTIKTRSNQAGINFVADTVYDQLMWTDGVKCLVREFTNKQMRISKDFEEDVESLTRLQMRAKLIQEYFTISFPDVFTFSLLVLKFLGLRYYEILLFIVLLIFVSEKRSEFLIPKKILCFPSSTLMRNDLNTELTFYCLFCPARRTFYWKYTEKQN